jgi:hypothetical protein
VASTLGDGLTPSFSDRSAPRLPLSAPVVKGSKSPGLYSRRMRELELTVRELLSAAQQERKSAAQQERKAKLDAGRVATVFQVGDKVLLRTKELLDAADTVSCGRCGTDPSPSWPARDPMPTRSRSRDGCYVARR